MKEKGLQSKICNPLIYVVPGARIELAQPQGPRDFKSLASTNSATQACIMIAVFHIIFLK